MPFSRKKSFLFFFFCFCEFLRNVLKCKLSGGVDRPIPPTISFLRPGFIAHRCDQLQAGERSVFSSIIVREELTYSSFPYYRVIAVNDIKVASLTHEQILTVLR